MLQNNNPANRHVCTFIVLLYFLTGCMHILETTEKIARNQDFNNNWKFIEGDVVDAEKVNFDSSQWRSLDLPHDWSIEDYDQQDDKHIGPFKTDLENGASAGYLRGGTGWYRKHFNIDKKNRDKQVFLHFDGVQSETILYINGQKAGNHVYGYTPFYFNITPYLNKDDSSNLVAIKVVKPENNSRWHSGAGIYRPVSISFLNSVAVDIWGVAITSDLISLDKATVNIQLTLNNTENSDIEVTVIPEITSPVNTEQKIKEKKIRIPAQQKKLLSFNIAIANPKLWDIQSPQLYTATVSVFRDKKIIDKTQTRFGIRTIDYSAERGFLLNGKAVLLKGANLHHDNGLLGAAAFARAERRRVEIMKNNGFNAIRSSHNPPSQAFLDACDELGMLVIDESFDAWQKAKRPNDYHQYYKAWWQKDTQAMLLRDRNHPSIIMWSIGNEIPERAEPSGVKTAKAAAKFIKSIDPTRPVTQAVCKCGRKLTWEQNAPAFLSLDIGGYNYQWKQYAPDHEKFPDRIMYGSESIAKHAYENWQAVKNHSYVIGDFIWTGMDYLGESGIGHILYHEDINAKRGFLMPWPWYIANCGDIDILGNKKPQSYYRDVVWGESKLEILVHEPFPKGKHELVNMWGWPKEYRSWNWQDHEGQSLQVMVYSSYPKVRLTLNNKIIGEQTITQDSMFKAKFIVPYTPGELKASGIINNTEQESKTLQTTGPVAKLKLEPEQTEIKADRSSIAYIRVLAVDDNNKPVPNTDIRIEAGISGNGEIIAAGNASPLAQGSLQDKQFNLFQGRGMIIVRSTGQAGRIKIQVKAAKSNLSAATSINAIESVE